MSNVAVAVAEVEPLVTARPIQIGLVMVTVVFDPTCVHDVPLVDLQALKVLLGLSYLKGEVVENPITGQAAVCQSIARAMTTGRMILEIPCVGDRTYGLVHDDELVVVVPASKVKQILEGMKGTDAFAPYPFRPFLTWPALFPPEFEPTRSEIDRK